MRRKSDVEEEPQSRYRITSSGLNVWIFGELSDIAAAELLEHVNEVAESPDPGPIIVGIYSLGGDASAGMALRNPLQKIGREIHTVALGEVHSAAVDLFLVGAKRLMDRYSMLVVHQPYETTDAEHLNDKRISLEGLKLSVRLTVEYMSMVTGTTAQKISSMLRSGAVLNAEKALKLGFATEII